MTPKLRPPAVLFLLAALIPLGDPAAAQGKAPTTAAPKSQPQPVSSIQREPMVFYLAKGEGDACGPGCSEWIAAEGAVDIGAPQRLRTLLSRLGKRKLPIFFHSPGGLAAHAMDMGRLLRERQMTAGVSKTNPAGCIGASDESCRTLKRSGQTLDAELSNVAGCNSACVLVLIGAKARQVPPGAQLGVHAGKPVQLYPDGRVKAALPGNMSAESTAQIRRYYKEMQIPVGLFELGAKVPHERAHYLSRDEIATFGLDTREFLESRWTADGSPQQLSAVLKFVVEARGPSRNEFRTSIFKLACAGPRRMGIGYFRGLASDEIAATRSIKLTIGDRDFSFAPKGSITKIDSIDTGRSFDVRFTYESFEFFEAAAARDSIDVIETDPTDTARPPRVMKLSTSGLSKALQELQKECGDRLPEPPGGLWGRK
jgi:hypothetical protein